MNDEQNVFYGEAEAKETVFPKLIRATMIAFNKVKLDMEIPINLTGKDNEGITIKTGKRELEILSVKNPADLPLENLGYEITGDKIHFVLKPGMIDVPLLDSTGKSNVFIAGGMNGWNGSGAEDWKMIWNADKKYYELTKNFAVDINYWEEFKFINVIDGYTNWMSGYNIKVCDMCITDTVVITTSEKMVFGEIYYVNKDNFDGKKIAYAGSSLFNSKEFEDEYLYEENDLGIKYSKNKTTFRVWAPLAEKIVLMVYKDGDISSDDIGTPYEMTKSIKGTWAATLHGDQKGIFYTYKVTNYGIGREAADPYAVAVGVNGDRAAVVDLDETDPANWCNDTRPQFGKIEDAVIYELHIRDLAMDKDSGINNKGKYMEFIEEGTKSPQNASTGIEHLKELGITHLHLLPTFDYWTIDEKTLDKNEFNWGYDPKNFNVPEGSYATDPYKPEVRINEYKQMVQTLHKNGIRVVFDAVYNHTYESINSTFHKIVPGYYYRMQDDGSFHNGSGCGTETATERKMCRKYLVDSIKFWVKEYHIDGFRFDLMGLHDIETMNAIRGALDTIDSSLILYGEGWDMGCLPWAQKAIQPFAKKLPGVGFFNDSVRDNLKGCWDSAQGHGFVDGMQNFELEIMQGAAGSIHYNDVVKDYNLCPGQSVNYVANHDNGTLWDKLHAANPFSPEADIRKMHKLANAAVFTFQGVAYLHAGEEFLRSKCGDHNSYKSPDSINALKWSKKAENFDIFNYFKGLIMLRNSHPAFRMPDVEMIRTNLVFIDTPKNTVAFVLKNNANNDSWKNIFVAYNANNCTMNIEIPNGKWNVVVNNENAGVDIIETVSGSNIDLAPLSAIVMYTNDTIAIKDLFENKKIIKARLNSDRMQTLNGEIIAQERVVQYVDDIYLPLRSIVDAAAETIEMSQNDSTVVIKHGSEIIVISLYDFKVWVNGEETKLGYRMINSYGKLLVSRDFVQDILRFKVFADYRRFNGFGGRESYGDADVYVLYE